MTEMTWVRYHNTGQVAQIPADAVPMLRQQAEPLTDEEAQAHEQSLRDEQEQAERRLVQLGQEALGNEPTAGPPIEEGVPASEPEQAVEAQPADETNPGKGLGKRTSKENG